MASPCDSDENGSYSNDDSFEISNTSDFSLDLNCESIDEEEEVNVLGVVPYQFEPEYDTDDPAIQPIATTSHISSS